MSRGTEITAYAGSTVATVVGKLTWGDVGAIFGILCAVATVLINWYYKHREIRLKEKALEKRINWEKLNNE